MTSTTNHPATQTGGKPHYGFLDALRGLAALAFMVGAKMANVSVPLLLKELIDTMNPKGGLSANALLLSLIHI